VAENERSRKQKFQGTKVTPMELRSQEQKFLCTKVPGIILPR